jgi:outer membrane protein OmpA-like peptidoglycan-associated protein
MSSKTTRFVHAVVAVGFASITFGCARPQCPQTVVHAPPPEPEPRPARVEIPEPVMVEEWVQLPGRITFEPNRAVLTAEGEAALIRLADELRAQEVIEVRVDGHVNSHRQSPRGQELSTERARVVMERLVELGFAAELFETSGHGGTQPVVTDAVDRNAEEQNRRVELQALIRKEARSASSPST